MNLIIDIGNSFVKAALFNKSVLVECKTYESTVHLLSDSAYLKRADVALMSSVVTLEAGLLNVLQTTFPSLILFNQNTAIPIKNMYQSPATLGSDRLAAAVGASVQCPNKNILVVDTGTCIKFNFITENKEYLGGSISPGLTMRFKALAHFTDKLPLINFNDDFDKLIGATTEESILSGVINGIILETDAIIDAYKNTYPDLTIVVSGGDTEIFAKRLKNCIFANPHLVMYGLNEILIFNS